MSNLFFFNVLPYVSLLILIVGSATRFFSKSYKVTALSSQFLEYRNLFWGSNSFHYGILVLFFGHLIAFLFPKSVLAWNAVPLRLVILEITALAFGILSFAGIIILIYRRLSNRRLTVVASKMDFVVYLIIFIQVITGIWVAYGSRWGSSWFASVLTPYLYSIFKLAPDSAAIATMPLAIKIHVVSAYVLFSMVPFTRFFHFLAFPFTYYWRSYQVVIWYWDRKKIRKTV